MWNEVWVPLIKWISLGVTLFLFVNALESFLNSKKVIFLSQVKKKSLQSYPKVSLIFSARDEEDDIQAALSSHLTQKYPNFEVIVVNDRSTDRTGKILSEEKSRTPHLKIITITELEKGWVAKNFGLWSGAQAATGDWLLFTDADVRFHPDTLWEAVSYSIDNKVDHNPTKTF